MAEDSLAAENHAQRHPGRHDMSQAAQKSGEPVADDKGQGGCIDSRFCEPRQFL